MVDGGGLENRCTRKGIGGSNPSPSAKPPQRAANARRGPRKISPSARFARGYGWQAASQEQSAEVDTISCGNRPTPPNVHPTILENALSDAWFAVRSLRRVPGYTAASVLILHNCLHQLREHHECSTL